MQRASVHAEYLPPRLPTSSPPALPLLSLCRQNLVKELVADDFKEQDRKKLRVVSAASWCCPTGGGAAAWVVLLHAWLLRVPKAAPPRSTNLPQLHILPQLHTLFRMV